MNTAERGLLASLSFVVTISSLWLAECVGGPAARFIFGVPAGFREDFTSPWALRQAFLVQVFFLAVAFLVLGAAVEAWTSKKFGYRDALWGANPITVGIGSATYKMTHHWARLEDMLPEYDSFKNLRGVLLYLSGGLRFLPLRWGVGNASLANQALASLGFPIQCF